MRTLMLSAAFYAAAFTAAAENGSVYTKTAGPDCRMQAHRQDGVEAGSTTVCKGFAGVPVTLYEGDSRIAVSYGRKPSTEPAAKVWFGPLNSVGDMLEWRVETAHGVRLRTP